MIVPATLQEQVVEELRRGHPEVFRMKFLAYSHVWWPELECELETQPKACHSCQLAKNAPAKEPLHTQASPTNPWQRTHVDFAGPVRGKMLFIAVDAHSKCPEAVIMNSTTASQTINCSAVEPVCLLRTA